MTADRNNKGKLRWELVDLTVVEDMLRVLEFGAEKYSPNNWKLGLHREENLESIMRHLVELFNGKEVDYESGLYHMAHIMCGAMFHLHHLHNQTFSKERKNPFKNEDKKDIKTN